MNRIDDSGYVGNGFGGSSDRFPHRRPPLSKPDGWVAPHPDRGISKGNVPASGGGGTPAPSGGGGAGGYAPAAPSGPSYGDIMMSIMQAQREARQQAYDKAAEAQRRNMAFATGQLNDTTDRALQEAYINKMMTLRNLPQQLSAQGLNGGTAETTTASLYNNYGNARNQLELERAEQLGALQNTFQNNMAQLAAQLYNGQAADLAAIAPQLGRIAAANTPTTVSTTQGNPLATKRLLAAFGFDEDYE